MVVMELLDREMILEASLAMKSPVISSGPVMTTSPATDLSMIRLASMTLQSIAGVGSVTLTSLVQVAAPVVGQY
jgi:hypothetical protein